MRRVARLPDAVANQIAAGEVVERPASAVKELLENALDAEATRVRVDIAGGGIELIRVTDDGFGMLREDAVLALERHATSKIASAADLHHVDTLGFRGEAIPSIASVSRFVLVTVPRSGEEGTRIEVEGGHVRSVGAAGAAPGTTIEVRDLFYNLPARRKFLKTAQTEVGHVSDAIVRLALARPDVAFTLTSEGRTLLDVPASAKSDPRGRLGRILGRAVAEQLYPILPDGRPHAVEVTGFISSPELNERTARSLHAFVNGRYVRDRTIQHAIQDGYRTLLERGRHPVVVLHVELDPERVDVNVHPQKIEVRFQDTGEIHRAVSAALSRTLAEEPWIRGERGGRAVGPSASVPVEALRVRDREDAAPTSPPELPPSTVRRYVLAPRSWSSGAEPGTGGPRSLRDAGLLFASDAPRRSAPFGAGGAAPSFGRKVRPSSDSDERWAPAPAARPEDLRDDVSSRGNDEPWLDPPGGPRDEAGEAEDATSSASPSVPEDPRPRRAEPAQLDSGVGGGRFGSLEPVGQVMATYLVCQAPGRMVLVDQHAAHERIAFERMRKEARASAVSRQPLLVPLPIELDATRAAMAHEAAAQLLAIGLELEPFGGATWLVKSRPSALGGSNLQALVFDVLDELAEFGAATPFEERFEAILARAACHAVVRAGNRLTTTEMKALLQAMDEIDFGAHCPHGRPVFVEWSERELAGLFHRT